MYIDNGYAAIVVKRLRASREEAGFTASVVAEHLNISTAWYALYEEYELVPHQLVTLLCRFRQAWSEDGLLRTKSQGSKMGELCRN